MNPYNKETAARTILPLRAAIYHAVHDQRGGVGAVAGALGLNANTLQHKINPHAERHQLSMADVEAILGFTRDPRIMDSLCAIFGDAYWLDLRSDGIITRSELDVLEKDAALLHQTVQAIITRATSMLEQ